MFSFTSVKPRYKLMEPEDHRATNWVGGTMAVSAFVLAVVINLTGFDMREYPSLRWLWDFHTVRLHAGFVFNHQREALVVWAYLSLSSPFYFLWMLRATPTLKAENNKHLRLCTLLYIAVGAFCFQLAWAVGMFESVIAAGTSEASTGSLAVMMRTTLWGLVLMAAALHFVVAFSAVVLLRVWCHKFFG